MNVKLMLGIFLPLVIIILSVLLIRKEPAEQPLPIIELQIETVNSIPSVSLFVDKTDVSYDRIIIQTVIPNKPISSPQEVNLPVSRICLFDIDGLKAMRDVDFEYALTQQGTAIKLLIVPLPKSAFDSELQPYTYYDEILLMGPEKSCRVLEFSNLENVTHIAIEK